MTTLEVMLFNVNHFQGEIPDLSALSSLNTLDLSENSLSGTIPSNWGSLHKLSILQLGDNKLHGTIPHWIGTLNLTMLSLRVNMLTGTLPRNIVSSRILSTFLVNDNQLSGNLYVDYPNPADIHISATNSYLLYFMIGNNQFTGSLPSVLFEFPSLKSLSAFTNCLDVHIPDTVCSNNESLLISLVLDGMQTATSCRKKIFPHSAQFDAFILRESNDHPTIPACLFSMPNLKTLHLSGNGYRGSLTDNIHINSVLFDLSLSHNHLDGTIPIAFQNRSWTTLDLSFNFFSGELSKTFGNISIDSLSLEVNKLSGDIPANMKSISDISILDGNLFSCDYDNKQLPGRDPAKTTFNCGSNAFNASYYTWLAAWVLAVAVTVLAILMYGLVGLSQSEDMVTPSSLYSLLFDWTAFYQQQYIYISYVWRMVEGTGKHFTKKAFLINTALSAALGNFSGGLDEVWMLCSRVLFYMLVVLVPVFTTAGYYYGTYSNTYAWVVSMAYTSGDQPGAMQLVVLLVLLGLLVASLHEPWQKPSKDIAALKMMESGKTEKMVEMEMIEIDATAQQALTDPSQPVVLAPTEVRLPHAHPQTIASRAVLNTVSVVVILVNLMLVGGINALFAYVSIYGTNTQLLLMQIALAVFGFVWNSDRIQWLSTELISWYSGSKSLLSLKHSKYFDSAYLLKLHAKEMAEQHEMLHLQHWIAIINVVWIPCVVTAALSSSCFYHVLKDPPQVSTITYGLPTCMQYTKGASGDWQCAVYIEEQPRESAYNAPFSYSYQCSSVLLTYYAPSLMYTCIMDGFLSPVFQLLFANFYLWLTAKMPADTATTASSNACYAGCERLINTLLMWMKWRVVPDLLQPLDAEDGHAPDYCGQTFVSSQGIMVTLVTYVALLLTFGVVFPPLGAALVITIMAYILYNRWMLGKFLAHLHLMMKDLIAAVMLEDGKRAEEGNASAGKDGASLGTLPCTIYDALVMECANFPKVLQATKWMLVTTACWFYALFMADTIGYEHGTKQAYWVIILMALMPIGFYAADWFAGYLGART